MTRLNTLPVPGPLALRTIKALIWLLCLAPALLLALGWQADNLGANPVETLIRSSGDWALRLLLITLAVTPLRKLSGLHWLVRLRRLLGLFAFAWGVAHLLVWLSLDQFLEWQAIAHELLQRPFLAVGLAALLLMLPLAASSNGFAIRRLGGRRWQALHRATHVVAILGVLHFWMLVKADLLEPLLHALVLSLLLGLRLWWRLQERRAARPAPLRPPGKVIRIVPRAR